MKLGLAALERGQRSAAGRYAAVPARCATGWASRACARPRPAARRSGPTPSASSWRWACRCASSTARPSWLGAYTIHRTGDGRFRHGRRAVRRDDRDRDRPAGPERRRRDRDAPPEHVPRLLRNEAADSARRCGDGWMHTGDAGYFDEAGQLVVIDRIKDLATTSAGDRFSPQYIENKLKFSPFIAEAVVLGDERPYLAAMICIRFADRRRNGPRSTASPSPPIPTWRPKPEVRALIRREVEAVNADPAGGPAHPRLPAALQGAGRRRRRADPHPQGPARRHRREIRRHHRGDLSRRRRHRGRHHHRLPGRHEAAHPHHARGRGHARADGTRRWRRNRSAAHGSRICSSSSCINGLIVGTLYGVVGMCFVLIYKASQVVNFAQGEFLLIGAWVCWWLLTKYQLPFSGGFLVTLVFMMVFGILLQVVVLRPMIGEPVISVIMVTIGLSIFFQALMKWIFGVLATALPADLRGQVGRCLRAAGPDRLSDVDGGQPGHHGWASPGSSNSRAWASPCGRPPSTSRWRSRSASRCGRSSRSVLGDLGHGLGRRRRRGRRGQRRLLARCRSSASRCSRR